MKKKNINNYHCQCLSRNKNQKNKNFILKYKAIPDTEIHTFTESFFSSIKDINFEEEKNLLFSLLTELGVDKKYQKKCLEMLYKDWCKEEKNKNNFISEDLDTFIKYCINK
uniref:hypothetical protein n=1 Tax=Ulva meridionalis TaxID=434723 RepID=UPI0028E0A33F|nr:hypothetical protein NQY40_pgp025 [Ulva meridionalis]WFS80086.1 hypothetical protein [Ulva meridionalis]